MAQEILTMSKQYWAWTMSETEYYIYLENAMQLWVICWVSPNRTAKKQSEMKINSTIWKWSQVYYIFLLPIFNICSVTSEMLAFSILFFLHSKTQDQ